MRSLTLNQWRDLRMGVICEDSGALTTARAREFWICWRRLSWQFGRFDTERVTVVEFGLDNGGGNGAGCFEVDTVKFTNVIVAGFRKCRDLVWEGKVFVKNKAKVARRVGYSERGIMYLKVESKGCFRRRRWMWRCWCRTVGQGKMMTLLKKSL